MPAHNSRRVTPFGHPRIKALSAAPRGLSRPHTSFIGTACQGIHHTPMATNPPTPQKGATGPCHLHWNTLRQLIRSSKHHPHQQCGRLYQNTREHNPRTHPKAGTERFDKINSTNTPGTPARAHRSCSRPLSSSQTTTPHHPRHPPHKGRDQDGGNGTPPPTRGLAVREPNSMHHTTTTPTTQAGTALTLFQPARDTTRPGSQAVKHPIIGAPRAPTKLRRKEVIQPHLPVRLPCYDLVPITSLTLDGSPHKG